MVTVPLPQLRCPALGGQQPRAGPSCLGSALAGLPARRAVAGPLWTPVPASERWSARDAVGSGSATAIALRQELTRESPRTWRPFCRFVNRWVSAPRSHLKGRDGVRHPFTHEGLEALQPMDRPGGPRAKGSVHRSFPCGARPAVASASACPVTPWLHLPRCPSSFPWAGHILSLGGLTCLSSGAFTLCHRTCPFPVLSSAFASVRERACGCRGALYAGGRKPLEGVQ